MKTINLSLLLLVLFTFFSCKKNISEPAVIAVDNQETQAGVPTYPLDWENIDFMPTPPGVPTIIVPWGSGASTQFTIEMRNDYHKIDGWELVYNTFNTTTVHDNWYFILYNKYRGLLRLYYYIPSTANYIDSKNIVHALSTEGTYASSSPLLNFAGNEVIDVAANPTTTTSMVEQWQVARSTWYALQYELAYDQNYGTNQNFTNFSLKWPLRSTQITSVDINGNISGTLTGSIAVPGMNLTLSPNISIDKSANKSTTTINGSSDAEKLLPALGTKLVSGIKSGIEKGVSGLISNLLSGLFKKTNNAAEQNVNMKLQAAVSLQGTLTSDFLISSPAFAIPGCDQTNTPGFIPAYPDKLGVFYISTRPVINKTTTSGWETFPDGTDHRVWRYTMSIAPNSYQLIFNPAVTSIATIQNVKAEIVSLDPDVDANSRIFGTLETLPGHDPVYSRVTGGRGVDIPIVFGTLAVRISFEVVPNNGATPVVIVKTFLATVVSQ